jgi:apolipoprotein N-acyltransferase
MSSTFQKIKTIYLFPIVSGILTGCALLYLINWLAWIMLVPLFYSIIKEPKNTFLKAAICGFVQGLIVLSWMFSSIGKYTGSETSIGFVLWIVSSVYFAFIIGLSAWLFTFILKRIRWKKMAWVINAVLAGSIWVLIDWLRTRLTPGVPWLHYQYFCTQSKWDIPLQIISLTGVTGLTFLIVAVNALIAKIIISKKYYRILLPLAIYSLLLLFGSIRLGFLPSKQKSIKIALICENINAKQRWLPETGDSLASIFFNLNLEAIKIKPQLIVWGESAIPWDLAMNDDLISQCLKITWPCQAGHIIGIFSPSEKHKNKRFNSAYYIKPDGAITGRYDKMQLLSFLEEPFGGKKLPFFSKGARTDIIPGDSRKLIQTPYGKAGILICNETLAPLPFRETIELGADFFVVLSNDAWFEGSQLIKHHFYFNRLRAVESGVDMIINSNRGISGIIDSKGRIQISDRSNKPELLNGSIHSGSRYTFYSKNGDWFVYLACIYLIIIVFTIIFTKQIKL